MGFGEWPWGRRVVGRVSGMRLADPSWAITEGAEHRAGSGVQAARARALRECPRRGVAPSLPPSGHDLRPSN